MRSIASSLFVCVLLVLATFSSAWIQHSMTSIRRLSSALRATEEPKSQPEDGKVSEPFVPKSQPEDGEVSEPFVPKVWPKHRPPTPNVKLLNERMDATWGRGKFRAEVWSGQDNPEDDWTSKYAPSEEEIEAMLYGFDFTNPRQYFKEAGINYDEAMAETKRVAAERAAALEAEREVLKKKITEDKAFRDEYLKLQDVLYEVAYRAIDNQLQQQKGQPSLDNEDTGIQYKNDPV